MNVGRYMNFRRFFVRIWVINNYNRYIEKLRNALYTQLCKFTHFEFMNLNDEEETGRLLEKQGEVLINRER